MSNVIEKGWRSGSLPVASGTFDWLLPDKPALPCHLHVLRREPDTITIGLYYDTETVTLPTGKLVQFGNWHILRLSTEEWRKLVEAVGPGGHPL